MHTRSVCLPSPYSVFMPNTTKIRFIFCLSFPQTMNSIHVYAGVPILGHTNAMNMIALLPIIKMYKAQAKAMDIIILVRIKQTSNMTHIRSVDKKEERKKNGGLTLTWLEVWMCKPRLPKFGSLSR